MSKFKNIFFAAMPLAMQIGSALAQSSVSIYGNVDVGVLNGKFDRSGSRTVVQSGVLSGGRIGLRGTEDLGGGLFGRFRLEGSMNNDTGAGGARDGSLTFNRYSLVALGHKDWGEISLGNNYSPMYAVFSASEPGFLWSMSASQLQQTSAVTGKSGWGSFYTNLLRYNSPRWAGVRFDLAYSPNGGSVNSNAGTEEQSGNAKNDGRLLAANLQYDNGPLYLGAAYQQFTTFKTDTGDASQNTWLVAARYKFGAPTIGVNLGRTGNSTFCYASGNFASGSNSGCDMRTFAVNGIWDLDGTSTLLFGVAQVKATSGSLNGAKARTLTLGYHYKLSKRTKLYLQGSRMENNERAPWGLDGGLQLRNGSAGFSPRAVGLGIYHVF